MQATVERAVGSGSATARLLLDLLSWIYEIVLFAPSSLLLLGFLSVAAIAVLLVMCARSTSFLSLTHERTKIFKQRLLSSVCYDLLRFLQISFILVVEQCARDTSHYFFSCSSSKSIRNLVSPSWRGPLLPYCGVAFFSLISCFPV